MLIPISSLSDIRLLLFVAWVTAGPPAIFSAPQERDVKGSKDHPMISRMEGAVIRAYDQKEFDEYRLVKGPVSGYAPDGQDRAKLEDALNDSNSVRLEGRVSKITYKVPANRSTLEMARSYEDALTKAGFKILYRCSGTGCADPLPKSKYVRSEGVQASALSNLIMSRAGYRVAGVYADQRYVAAHLARPEGDVYVSMLALRSPMVQLDVIEVKAMHAGLVTVNAATMAAEIAARGSVALYGIYFDTDKSDVRPESRPTLNEIATLLKQSPALELIVVGHTDNKGTIEYNLDLSQRRARAVVSALVTNFGIEGKRLDPRGVGFLAPVAPNTSEDGRAKNRRVQLIAR